MRRPRQVLGALAVLLALQLVAVLASGDDDDDAGREVVSGAPDAPVTTAAERLLTSTTERSTPTSTSTTATPSSTATTATVSSPTSIVTPQTAAPTTAAVAPPAPSPPPTAPAPAPTEVWSDGPIGERGLYIVEVGTGRHRRVAAMTADQYPALSHDGRHVVFGRGRDLYRKALVHLDLATGVERQLLAPSSHECSWGIGPRLLCQERRDSDGKIATRFILDVVTDRRQAVRGPDGTLAWSPAIKRIAVLREDLNTLSTMAEDGGGVRRLAEADHLFTGPVLWAPDGTYLAIGPLEIISADGRERHQRWKEEAPFIDDWSWAPDAEALVFNGTLQGGGTFVVRRDEDWQPRRIGPYSFEVEWSPDGRHIAVTAGRSEVTLLDPDGKPGAVVARTAPDWGRFDSLQWFPDSDAVLVWATPHDRNNGV